MDMERLVGQKAAVFVRKGLAFWPFWSAFKASKTRILSRILKRIASCCTENPKKMSAGEILARKMAKRLVYQKHIPHEISYYLDF